jgi:hypothetical protein
MEDWQKELTNLVENLTKDATFFVQEVTESFEELTQELQNILVNDLDVFWQELMGFIDTGIYPPENSEFLDDFLNPRVEPSADYHPACRGCSNYHGKIYSQQLLVCGIHPYGWTADESCPDWQSASSDI